MFFPWEELNGRHPDMEICTKVVERKRWRRFEEETHASAEVAFWAYGHPLTMIYFFNNLRGS